MKIVALSLLLAIVPTFAGADELDRTLGGMTVLGEQCAGLVADKPELATAINQTLKSVEVWKSSAPADKLSDFQTGFDDQTAKNQAKPVRQMDCAIVGLYFFGFATALTVPK